MLTFESFQDLYTWSDALGGPMSDAEGIDPIPSVYFLPDGPGNVDDFVTLDLDSAWTLQITDDEAGVSGFVYDWAIRGTCTE